MTHAPKQDLQPPAGPERAGVGGVASDSHVAVDSVSSLYEHKAAAAAAAATGGLSASSM